MSEEPKEEKENRRKGDFFGISALASALLSGLAGEKLSQSLDSGGWVSVVGFVLTAVFALIWAAYNAPGALRRYKAWRRGVKEQPELGELHEAAEEAEQWMFSLGSNGVGMAAAEWFSQHEQRLWELLHSEKSRPDTADDLARICSALEAWYIRRNAPGQLLELGELLAAVADACRRNDLAELAAARTATAYRLMGDPTAASTWIGISDDVAPSRRARSRTKSALETRREVERALLHLARAEQAPSGSNRDEAVLNAQHRLDDARLFRPGPDLAAEVAIHIDLAIVRLYQNDPEGALDQLRPAAAQAAAAGDLSAEAHARELTGVAAWMLANETQARAWWNHAMNLYAAIDEREGRARCLQHLGSADVVTGSYTRGRQRLEQSAMLRGRDSALVTKYLAVAAANTSSSGDTPEPDEGMSWHRLSRRWLLRRVHTAGDRLKQLTRR